MYFLLHPWAFCLKYCRENTNVLYMSFKSPSEKNEGMQDTRRENKLNAVLPTAQAIAKHITSL